LKSGDAHSANTSSFLGDNSAKTLCPKQLDAIQNSCHPSHFGDIQLA